MYRWVQSCCGLLSLWLHTTAGLASEWRPIDLSYQPAPPDNPLKGFVDYPTSRTNFPHSLNWSYFSVAQAMPGPGRFDWTALETELRASAGRGCQLIPRFYLEYPGRDTAIPRHLIDTGVATHRWTNSDGQLSATPDYEDPRLRAALVDFIAAYGREFDGDPRIGFIEEGVLGSWGEWHDSPHDNWFASPSVQQEVMDAYEKAFTKTRLLVRYPAGVADRHHAVNANRRVGYHDDSFAYATLDTGRKGDSWFFMTLMNAAGTSDKWRQQPIGGEVRPEVWDCLFNDPGCAPAGQSFNACVAATHASWLCYEGAFRSKLQGAARERSLQAALGLGYEFHLLSATCRPGTLPDRVEINLSITNSGIAPFYYNWPVELALLGRDGRIRPLANPGWKTSDLIPGEGARNWACTLKCPADFHGPGRILARIRNPMPGGRPVRFANQSQDLDSDGWLTVSEFRRE